LLFGSYIFSIDVVNDWFCRHEMHWISASSDSTRFKLVALLTHPPRKYPQLPQRCNVGFFPDGSNPGAVAVLRMWRQILVGLELGGEVR
jgi:hypothetical protein